MCVREKRVCRTLHGKSYSDSWKENKKKGGKLLYTEQDEEGGAAAGMLQQQQQKKKKIGVAMTDDGRPL